MGLIRNRVGYDRTRILDAAARARSRKKRERAIALYRWVLAAEPKNLELHGKLGPLLAESGQHFDAWSSFRLLVCPAASVPFRFTSGYRSGKIFVALHSAVSGAKRANSREKLEPRSWSTLLKAPIAKSLGAVSVEDSHASRETDGSNLSLRKWCQTALP